MDTVNKRIFNFPQSPQFTKAVPGLRIKTSVH